MKNRAVPLAIVTSALVATVIAKHLSRSARVWPRQVVVITGGSSGLVLALAHRFGEAGLRLVLAARDSDDLDSARNDLGPILHSERCSI